MKKTLLWICTILLLSTLSLAACPGDPGCPFSPDNPGAFNYVSGDYSTISDWSKVDWSSVPAERIGEVPADKINYVQLTAEQRLQMNNDQIAHNLERIENLATDVNPERAREAIKLSKGVGILSLGKLARIQNNVLLAQQGSFDFSGKTEWLIEIDEVGVINILKPAELSLVAISRKDHLRLNGAGFGESPEEIKLQVADRTIPVQSLSVKDGKLYVRRGDTAKVGDYSIKAEKNDVNVYLQEEETDRNYVKITRGLEVGTIAGGTVFVEPQPGNQLFWMVKRKYEEDEQGRLQRPLFVPDERDVLSIEAADGGVLSVVSREEAGLVPLITAPSSGEATIRTGRGMKLFLRGGADAVVIPPDPLVTPSVPPQGNPNSVPLEIISGEDRIVVSSSNRFLLSRNGVPVTGTDLGLPVSNLQEKNLVKTMDDLRARYPAINFQVRDMMPQIEETKQLIKKLEEDEGDNSLVALFTRVQLEEKVVYLQSVQIREISPNMAQTVDQWLVANPTKAQRIFSFEFDGEHNARAFSGIETGKMAFGESALDPSTLFRDPIRGRMPLEIIDHEYAHLQDNFVELDEEKLLAAQAITPDIRRKEGLQEKYDEALVEAYGRLEGKFRQYVTDLELRIKIIGLLPAVKEGRVDPKVIEEEWGQAVNRQDYEPYNKERIEKAQQVVAVTLLQLEEQSDADAIRQLGSSLDQAVKYYPPLAAEKKKLDKLTSDETLLPPYVFKDYDEGQGTDFAEVSSTYTEAKREDVRLKIAAGSEFVREVTQLAYDSGKLDKAEYEYRMGRYCENNPCGKCIIYTLTCRKE